MCVKQCFTQKRKIVLCARSWWYRELEGRSVGRELAIMFHWLCMRTHSIEACGVPTFQSHVWLKISGLDMRTAGADLKDDDILRVFDESVPVTAMGEPRTAKRHLTTTVAPSFGHPTKVQRTWSKAWGGGGGLVPHIQETLRPHEGQQMDGHCPPEECAVACLGCVWRAGTTPSVSSPPSPSVGETAGQAMVIISRIGRLGIRRGLPTISEVA
jgi:hypothetical protein